MSRAVEWSERRRLLVAQAALQRAQLACEVHALRRALPNVAAGSVLMLAISAVFAASRLRAGGALRDLLLRAWRAWRRERRH